MRRDVRPLELWRRQHRSDFSDQPGGDGAGVPYNACKRAVWVTRFGRSSLIIHGEDDDSWIRLDGFVVESLEGFVGWKRPIR